ncbi:MAG TPA: phospholipid carrier-dependent glycosyltransferase [Promineifilum sp.]
MTRFQRSALAVILLGSAVLRLTGLDWDSYQHHHPDERYITWVASTIEFPSLTSLTSASTWKPETSTFNPFHWPPEAGSEGIVVLQGEPRAFAYGHLPLYLGVAATRLAETVSPYLLRILPAEWTLPADVLNGQGRIEFHHLAAVGRALTALTDIGTVLLTFLIGRMIYGPNTGLLAAGMLSVSVLHIQLAHFFTADPYMTFFVVAAIYSMLAAHKRLPVNAASGRTALAYLTLAGAMSGFAVGSKFAAILLVIPLLWSSWVVARSVRARRALILPLIALIVSFLLTNPYTILDWTCGVPAVSGDQGTPDVIGHRLSGNCTLQNMLTQSAMVSGRLDVPFSQQYEGTTPYFYQLEMLLRWGTGPLIGLLGLLGLGWAGWHVARSLANETEIRRWPTILGALPEFTILLWVIPYVILTGSFYVKFPRYAQPIVPFLVLFGAALAVHAMGQGRALRVLSTGFTGLALLTGLLYALAFSAIYDEEHPWNAASRWIYDNVPAGTTILSEYGDDYLPVNLREDGVIRLREDYPNRELVWLSSDDRADDDARLSENITALATAEYVTITSSRAYGVVPRLPERYPLSAQYHQLLFDGSLGYELVWVGGRFPRLLGVELRPDTFSWPSLQPPAGVSAYLASRPGINLGRADESFVVYDQPLTMIFRNTAGLSPEALREQFSEPGE